MRFDRKYKPEICSSKDATRWSLSDLQLDADARRIVATDGHRLIAIPVEVPDGVRSGKVSAAALVEARGKARAADVASGYTKRLAAARKLGGRELPTPTPAELAPETITPRDNFPPWRQVVPARSAVKGHLCFNPTYLIELAKAIGSPDYVCLAWDPADQRNGYARGAIRVFGRDSSFGTADGVEDQISEPIAFLMPSTP